MVHSGRIVEDPLVVLILGRGGVVGDPLGGYFMTAQRHFLVPQDQDLCVTMSIALRNNTPNTYTIAQRKVPGILDRSQKTHFFQAGFGGYAIFVCYDGYCIARQNTNITYI